MPCCWDALSARLIERAGFPLTFMSGFAVSAARLALPDTQLISYAEMVEQGRALCGAVSIPVIGDADTGYGNALNVVRTVREFERAGATAIQLEDQDFPKRCGHLDGKALISAQEMCGKIRAAVDTRRSPDTLVIARTDAVAVEGFDRAIGRAQMYREAGSDILFVEAPHTRDDLARVAKTLGPSLPLLANIVEGGKTPVLPATELEALGFSLVIFPGAIVRALARAAEEFYGTLKANGTTDAFRNRMFDFVGLNDVIGTSDLIARGRQYEGKSPHAGKKASA